MTRLDRYIFSQSLQPLVLITLCVSAVIWLTQLLQRVDLVVDDGGGLWAFFRVAILIIPSLLTVIIPFAVLATTLYLLNRLMADSEIAVMNCAGASRLRIARPLILLGFLAALATLWLSTDLMPRGYREMKQIVREVRADIAKSLIQSGQFSTISAGLMVHAEEVRPGGQYLGLLVYDYRNPEKPVTYMAENGLYKNSQYGPRLHLARGNIQRVGKDGEIEIVRFDETAVDMTDYQKRDIAVIYEETERFTSELLHPDLSRDYDRQREKSLIAAGHARLATPIYPIFFVLIACAFMLRVDFNRFGYASTIQRVVFIAVVVRIFGYFWQNLAATLPAANILQYVWPAGASLIAFGLLMGVHRYGLRQKRLPSGAA